MTPTTKLVVYAGVLVAMVGAGAAVGAAVGPDGEDSERTDCAVAATMPSGLAATEDGYTLDIHTRQLAAGEPSNFHFAITGPDGDDVTDLDVVHERQLHLVVVGRNLLDYTHVHPEQDDDGMWSVTLPALAPGSYRVFADFTPAGGDRLTLAGDVTVLGEVTASELPEPSKSATVDGYDVRFDGDLAAGTESDLTITIERDGEPVTDVQPYLGALGHLVAVRDGDLAYVHVHPLDDADGPGGPSVPFAIELPTPGNYRLFFEFDHDGAVHTAQATVTASAAEGCPAPANGEEDEPSHGGHEG